MKVVSGNLLDVEQGAIFQQVNCMGIMGAGLAKQIANKWPHVKEEYKAAIQEFKKDIAMVSPLLSEEPDMLLGCFNITDIKKDLWVCNLFAQSEIIVGNDRSRKTNYRAFFIAVVKAMRVVQLRGAKDFHFPFEIGCGLARGSWTVVEEILRSAENALECEITIHKLN